MVDNFENRAKYKEETKKSHLNHQPKKTTFHILMYNFAVISICRQMKILGFTYICVCLPLKMLVFKNLDLYSS